MPEKKSKVELKKMVKDSLEELVIQDITMTRKNPIPLSLIRLSEKCIPIYIRNEEIYQNNKIDYSKESGEKNLEDVKDAIKTLRNLEVEKSSYDNPNKEIGGRIFTWHYPAVNGDATILLSIFTDDVLSLTEISKADIKIRLEASAMGVTEDKES